MAELEEKATCDLGFAENPDVAALNGEITSTGDLPPVGKRLRAEPLVVAPYQQIGIYCGVLTGFSKGTKSGISDRLSTWLVNLVC